jgi:hypothetical protein
VPDGRDGAVARPANATSPPLLDSERDQPDGYRRGKGEGAMRLVRIADAERFIALVVDDEVTGERSNAPWVTSYPGGRRGARHRSGRGAPDCGFVAFPGNFGIGLDCRRVARVKPVLLLTMHSCPGLNSKWHSGQNVFSIFPSEQAPNPRGQEKNADPCGRALGDSGCTRAAVGTSKAGGS